MNLIKLAEYFSVKYAEKGDTLVDEEDDKIIVHYESRNRVTPALVISISKTDSFGKEYAPGVQRLELKWVDDKRGNEIVSYEDQDKVLRTGLEAARKKWPGAM